MNPLEPSNVPSQDERELETIRLYDEIVGEREAARQLGGTSPSRRASSPGAPWLYICACPIESTPQAPHHFGQQRVPMRLGSA
jgi:hypothetical protein